ncbi:hypothetical protein BCR33DRAFT_717323 [Rhizoclosmatium globosum]|uniref:Uncharacterized protein n=1 Tax=Rhizoclosmatium globosum TaxID=329046 RepID=A0A1Y2C9Q5_9FUNG|nr:hypothetical protein BCR33DRAFT_717323 [Rhizoclosmatium globosum]|eukprot:ORY43637.1 hypothetical protein BCR33DRAFT_717323 [Rhizoclosmatium globosum]
MHAINVTDSSVPLKFDYIPATANETSSLDMLISERVDAPVPEYTNSRSVRNRSSLLAVLDMDIASIEPKLDSIRLGKNYGAIVRLCTILTYMLLSFVSVFGLSKISRDYLWFGMFGMFWIVPVGCIVSFMQTKVQHPFIWNQKDEGIRLEWKLEVSHHSTLQILVKRVSGESEDEEAPTYKTIIQ